LREGPKKPREVLGKSHETQEMTQKTQKMYSIFTKIFKQAIQVSETEAMSMLPWEMVEDNLKIMKMK
jgi:hypothetical protein